MHKILLIIFFSISLYIPFISNAAVLINFSPCVTTECQKQAAETERLNQEKIEAKKKADQIASQNAAIEAERIRLESIRVQEEKTKLEAQKETDRIKKETEDQLKIKELEDRIKKLESQQPVIETVIPIIPTQITEDLNILNKEVTESTKPKKEIIKPITLDKKITQPSVIIKTEELKDEIVKIVTPTDVVPAPTPIEKISWFRRFLNWFK